MLVASSYPATLDSRKLDANKDKIYIDAYLYLRNAASRYLAASNNLAEF